MNLIFLDYCVFNIFYFNILLIIFFFDICYNCICLSVGDREIILLFILDDNNIIFFYWL